jgi:CHASE3 domain sensor protein
MKMISQMNVVQNAARLAMDHRAARPGKTSRGAVPYLTVSVVAVGAAIVAVLFGVAYFLTV